MTRANALLILLLIIATIQLSCTERIHEVDRIYPPTQTLEQSLVGRWYQFYSVIGDSVACRSEYTVFDANLTWRNYSISSTYPYPSVFVSYGTWSVETEQTESFLHQTIVSTNDTAKTVGEILHSKLTINDSIAEFQFADSMIVIGVRKSNPMSMIAGVCFDNNRRPIPNAAIHALEKQWHGVRTATTNHHGVYILNRLVPSEQYQITITTESGRTIYEQFSTNSLDSVYSLVSNIDLGGSAFPWGCSGNGNLLASYSNDRVTLLPTTWRLHTSHNRYSNQMFGSWQWTLQIFDGQELTGNYLNVSTSEGVHSLTLGSIDTSNRQVQYQVDYNFELEFDSTQFWLIDHVNSSRVRVVHSSPTNITYLTYIAGICSREGRPLPGAHITATNSSGELSQTTTDELGFYRINYFPSIRTIQLRAEYGDQVLTDSLLSGYNLKNFPFSDAEQQPIPAWMIGEWEWIALGDYQLHSFFGRSDLYLPPSSRFTFNASSDWSLDTNDTFIARGDATYESYLSNDYLTVRISEISLPNTIFPYTTSFVALCYRERNLFYIKRVQGEYYRTFVFARPTSYGTLVGCVVDSNYSSSGRSINLVEMWLDADTTNRIVLYEYRNSGSVNNYTPVYSFENLTAGRHHLTLRTRYPGWYSPQDYDYFYNEYDVEVANGVITRQNVIVPQEPPL